MNFLASHASPGSALLDPVESALQARPLRSWSDAQKESVRQHFAALHRDWSAEWVPAREGVSAVSEIRVSEPDGTMVLAAEDIACWSFADPSRRGTSARNLDAAQVAIRAIADRMFAFDMGTTTGLAQESARIAPLVIRAAWADWLNRIDALLEGFSLTSQEPSGKQGAGVSSSAWSGALYVRWSWCGGTWSLGLPHEAVAALLGSQAASKSVPYRPDPKRPPKEPLNRALADQRLALRVMLEGVELSLGQLQELRLHDVVPLMHALNDPARVVSTDGLPVCEGWLGQSEGRIAVELAVPVPVPAAAMAPLSNIHSSKGKIQ